MIATLQPLGRALDRRIAQVAGTIPEARLLESIPGIGSHRALLICAEVLPIARFRSPRHLASYAGLAPRASQTGQRGIRHGPLPKGVNRWLRGALVQSIITHVRFAPESALTQYYLTQKARVGWAVARVATARKLARAIHAMLRTNCRWTSQDREPHRGQLLLTHAAATASL